jgi:hypothetical protein
MGAPGDTPPGARPHPVLFRRARPVPAPGARVTELPDPRLLGSWRLFRADPSLDFAPNVRMEFLAGGRLRYAFDAGDTSQSLMLIYRVEGDVLFTDNPLAPHATSTRFWFGSGDVLAMDFAGAIAWFIREI